MLRGIDDAVLAEMIADLLALLRGEVLLQLLCRNRPLESLLRAGLQLLLQILLCEVKAGKMKVHATISRRARAGVAEHHVQYVGKMLAAIQLP